jgi:hypothetical protein
MSLNRTDSHFQTLNRHRPAKERPQKPESTLGARTVCGINNHAFLPQRGGTCQPRATPWDLVGTGSPALKGRHSRWRPFRAMGVLPGYPGRRFTCPGVCLAPLGQEAQLTHHLSRKQFGHASSSYALLVTHYVALLLLLGTSAAEQSAAKVTFPGIRVFPTEKRVEVDANLSLNDGIVEFLMVQKAGKDYESLLITDAKASHLSVALGLIGLKKKEVELTKEGMVKSVPGHALIDGAVSVQLKWEIKGKVRTSTVEDLLIRRSTEKTPPTAPWIFIGSRIRDLEGVGKVFAGDYEKVLAGVWYDGSAVLNYSVRSRNPYWGDDAGFIVNKDEVPPRGTQVTVIITPWKNEDGK